MPHEKGQGAAFSFDNLNHSWIGAVELAIAIGVTYFLAAQFGLALRAQPGVAIFWPAAGFAVGALIALGPIARLQVAAGVAVASIASGIMIGRSPWLCITFSFVNVGHPLIVALLIERWCGRAVKLEDVPQVLRFLVASAVGAATGAVGAAIAVNLVDPTTSALHVWRLWFAAGLLGTVTVAPLLIGIGAAFRQPLLRSELIEGLVGCVTLAALSIFLISLPHEPWDSALPIVLVFPVLLWITVRCRPLFAAAAAFVVALAIVWSTISNVGHFGDPSIPLEARVLAAQTHVLAGALLALVLAALFADRRRSEEALKDSNDRFKDNNDRLQLALDGAQLGVWSIDPITGRFENDARDRQIHGHHLEALPKTLAEARTSIHPDDLPTLDAAFAASARTGSSYKAEYRLAPVSSNTNADQERWVTLEGTVVRGADGRPLRLLGVTRDITGRKLTEQKLQKSERESRELLGRCPLPST